MYAFQSQSSNLPWKKNAMSRLLRVTKVVKLMLSHPNQNIAKLKVDERQLLPMWDALFDWFIGISGIFESSLAKKDVQDAMQNFLRTVACTTVSKSSRRQKKEKRRLHSPIDGYKIGWVSMELVSDIQTSGSKSNKLTERNAEPIIWRAFGQFESSS